MRGGYRRTAVGVPRDRSAGWRAATATTRTGDPAAGATRPARHLRRGARPPRSLTFGRLAVCDPKETQMPINPDAVGATGAPTDISWDSDVSLLYALSVGAGAPDPTGFELEFTTENSTGITQKALPTMCVVLGMRSQMQRSSDDSPLTDRKS